MALACRRRRARLAATFGAVDSGGPASRGAADGCPGTSARPAAPARTRRSRTPSAPITLLRPLAGSEPPEFSPSPPRSCLCYLSRSRESPRPCAAPGEGRDDATSPSSSRAQYNAGNPAGRLRCGAFAKTALAPRTPAAPGDRAAMADSPRFGSRCGDLEVGEAIQRSTARRGSPDSFQGLAALGRAQLAPASAKPPESWPGSASLRRRRRSRDLRQSPASEAVLKGARSESEDDFLPRAGPTARSHRDPGRSAAVGKISASDAGLRTSLLVLGRAPSRDHLLPALSPDVSTSVHGRRGLHMSSGRVTLRASGFACGVFSPTAYRWRRFECATHAGYTTDRQLISSRQSRAPPRLDVAGGHSSLNLAPPPPRAPPRRHFVAVVPRRSRSPAPPPRTRLRGR